jgi:hypothetical protein
LEEKVAAASLRLSREGKVAKILSQYTASVLKETGRLRDPKFHLLPLSAFPLTDLALLILTFSYRKNRGSPIPMFTTIICGPSFEPDIRHFSLSFAVFPFFGLISSYLIPVLTENFFQKPISITNILHISILTFRESGTKSVIEKRTILLEIYLYFDPMKMYLVFSQKFVLSLFRSMYLPRLCQTGSRQALTS